MSSIGPRTKSRLRRAVVVAASVCLLVVAADWGLLWFQGQTAHPPHALFASPHDQTGAIMDHEHVEDGSWPAPPDTFATAVLPRSGTALVFLALMAGAAVVATSLARPVVPAMRGPPRAVGAPVAGRDELDRFCIARR